MKNRKNNRLEEFDYSQVGYYFLTTCCKYRTHWFGEIRNGKIFLNQAGKIAQQQIDWLQHYYFNIKIHNSIVMPNHVHILLEIINVGIGLDLSNNYADGKNETVEIGLDLSTSYSDIKNETIGIGLDLSNNYADGKNDNVLIGLDMSTNYSDIKNETVGIGLDLSNNYSDIKNETVGIGLDLSNNYADGIKMRTGQALSLQSEQYVNTEIKYAKSVSTIMAAYKTLSSTKIRQSGLTEFVWQRSFHDHIIRNQQSYNNIYEYITNNPKNWEIDMLNGTDEYDVSITELINIKKHKKIKIQ